MRRLFFKTLENKVDEIFTDYLEIHEKAIDQTKSNCKASLSQPQDQKKGQNMTVIKPVSNCCKMIGKTTETQPKATRPGTNSGARNTSSGITRGSSMTMLKNSKEEMYVSSAQLDICRTSFSVPFIEYLSLIRRNIHYEGSKILLYYKMNEMFSLDDKIFPGIN